MPWLTALRLSKSSITPACNMQPALAEKIATAVSTGHKPRHIRKALKMTGRQFRKHLRAGRLIRKVNATPAIA